MTSKPIGVLSGNVDAYIAKLRVSSGLTSRSSPISDAADLRETPGGGAVYTVADEESARPGDPPLLPPKPSNYSRTIVLKALPRFRFIGRYNFLHMADRFLEEAK